MSARMFTRQEIADWKKKGAIILTAETFKKSVIVHNNHPLYEYKGKRYYYADWLLTYLHKQYERLHNNHSEMAHPVDHPDES